MIIQSERVYIASTFMKAQIEIKGGKIVEIYPYGEKKVDVDYKRQRIVPGFYDIHTHGYLGFDSTEGDESGLVKWMEHLPKEGVCGFCPTTVTQSHDVLVKALKKLAKVKKKKIKGAEILGIHFEGPYINKRYKGAQPEEYIVKPSIKEFEEYQKAASGLIKIVTLAPEADKDYKLIKYLSKNGVNASIGHTNATFEEAMMAVANGAKGFTHTFNAMTSFGHRENGTVGAALRARGTFAEIICDGNHTSLNTLNIFFKEKKGKAILVSDSLMCKGYPVDSSFMFGGQEVKIYKDGSAHLTKEGNALAGSTLKINEGLRLLVEEALVPLEDAIEAATINPCRYLGIDDHKGELKVGNDADIVILKDDYSIAQTYCLGVAQL